MLRPHRRRAGIAPPHPDADRHRRRRAHHQRRAHAVRQERAGYGGVPFTMLKLRSMVTGAHNMVQESAYDSDGDGVLFKMRTDSRVTGTFTASGGSARDMPASKSADRGLAQHGPPAFCYHRSAPGGRVIRSHIH
ncbi:sugar transferase [Streptomyces sp.]|uniref:sugar transferase n=1 Tax=Streptomyces sp. TaxID=1931 RepID=UPI0039C8C17E